jgi:hypothetical protein
MVWVGIFAVKPKDSAYVNHNSCRILFLYIKNLNHFESNHTIYCLETIKQTTRVSKRLSLTVLYCKQRD